MTSDIDFLCSARFDWARQHSYVALDFPTWPEADAAVAEFGAAVDAYKVGLQLLHSAGMRCVETLIAEGKRVFLDVKLHDIPNTVAGALRAICTTGVEMVNVHAAGGRRMMEAAREAVDSSGHRPLLIAVTALSSLSDTDLQELDLPPSSRFVTTLSRLASVCGLDGVVASAPDVAGIYRAVSPPFLTVVPGTRPVGVASHDQARSLTPGEAVAAGATHLVLGRAVTGSGDRLGALERIWSEMEHAHAGAAREESP